MIITEQQKAIAEKLVAQGWAYLAQPYSERAGFDIYYWTNAGREACFRNKYTTANAWIDDITEKGDTAYCVVCYRDLYKKQCNERTGYSKKAKRICLGCGREGWTFDSEEKPVNSL